MFGNIFYFITCYFAYMYHLGIDAGVHTGYCLYNSESKEIVEIGTTDFFGLILNVLPEMLYKYVGESICNITIWIEDPSQNKPLFVKRYEPDTVRKALKLAQDVGSNKREALLLIQYFERKGFQVKRYKPTSEKWDKSKFWQITNYKKNVSQHARDACKMVFGR